VAIDRVFLFQRRVLYFGWTRLPKNPASNGHVKQWHQKRIKELPIDEKIGDGHHDIPQQFCWEQLYQLSSQTSMQQQQQRQGGCCKVQRRKTCDNGQQIWQLERWTSPCEDNGGGYLDGLRIQDRASKLRMEYEKKSVQVRGSQAFILLDPSWVVSHLLFKGLLGLRGGGAPFQEEAQRPFSVQDYCCFGKSTPCHWKPKSALCPFKYLWRLMTSFKAWVQSALK